MGKTKKTYSREFKLKVVQSIESGELRPAQACREYQIAESVLNRWRHEIRLRGAEAAFTPLTSPMPPRTTRRGSPSWSGSAANSPWSMPL
jgi:transposase-like protein